MNAFSGITALPTVELSLVPSLANLVQENRIATFNLLADGLIGRMNSRRAWLARFREEFFSERSFTPAERSLAIELLSSAEERSKLSRQSVAKLVRPLRQKARRHPFLRPLVNRLLAAFELFTLASMEFYRDARLELIAERSVEPEEADGPIMSTPEEVASYFAKFLAA